MLLLDGEKVAAQRLARLKRAVSKLKRSPHLAILLVGSDPASEAYVRQKQMVGERIGVSVTVHRSTRSTTAHLQKLVQRLSNDQRIDAILVQLPLPTSIDKNALFEAIDTAKDVDGLHPYNRGRFLADLPTFVPPTPLAVLSILDFYKIPLAGRHVAVVGRGDLVGKPLALLLLGRDALVTWAHRSVPNLGRVTRHADIVIMGTGTPGLLKGSMVRRGAVVVDTGWTRQGKKIRGDVDAASVRKVAGALTPVPGGVGPMTVVSLMENVVRAVQLRAR